VFGIDQQPDMSGRSAVSIALSGWTELKIKRVPALDVQEKVGDQKAYETDHHVKYMLPTNLCDEN
jgi:hypothetical protein